MIAKEIKLISVTEEVKTSYLHYALSIFNRALPSVSDGLKSAQRRIILGLSDLNLKPSGQFKKVSRLEGHVLGFYHPQGSIAGTAINMGQATGFRYPLTDIHGNVGGSLQSGPSIGQSTSEDPPAAARYLEIRSTALTQAVFIDELDKHACAWRDNYDGSTQEVVEIVPTLPTLLVNGAQGIASGYACHHVSYNLAEVVKATKAYIQNKQITTRKLFSYVTSPDLPNGARILDDEEIFKAFETGQGNLKLYGTWDLTEVEYGKRSKRKAIIVTSLASGSSEKFLEKVKDGLEAEKIEGIADLADHSSRDGIRIEVVLKASVDQQTVLSQLLAYTNLSDTLNVNATALAGGLPTLFGVKDIIAEWYKARTKALAARYQAEMARLDEQIHILNGLLKVLADIDRAVNLIKKSASKVDAREALKKAYKIDEAQADAVLSMALSKLVNTEQLELQSKVAELSSRWGSLAKIVSDPAEMDTHILSQLDSLKPFFDKLRTKLTTQAEIGVTKAKNNIVRAPKRAKLPTLRDKIKSEAKNLGIKAPELRKFLESSVGRGDLKARWEEYKKSQALKLSLTTRKGKAERRAILEGLKEAAQNRGMPKRGARGWNAFMDGKETWSIDQIEAALPSWLAQK